MQSRAEGDDVAGRYRLEAFIGRGGMGEVWRAHDQVLHRPVALKSAPTGDDRSADRLRASLVREARNAAQPHHPNIVEVFDFVVEDATCWIVMEYVPAPSLAQLIDEALLTPARAAAIGRQIADALAASHAPSVGVVHGDLTPENVLVRDDGVAKLTDFGISRAIWSDPTVDVTGTGGVRGKPRYLPPEVAKGHPGTEKSDVFSLGATLYAAVEGRSPYGHADNPMTYLARALAGAIEPPRRAGALTDTLTALLDPDPRRRPTAARARDMLARIAPPPFSAPGPAGGADPTWSVTIPLTRGRRWVLRRRPLVVGGAALTTVAAVLAGLILWGPGAHRPDPGPPHPQGPSRNAGVLLDARTADPCALLDPRLFRSHGAARIDPYYGELNRCDVLVAHHGDDALDIRLTFAADPGETDSQSAIRRVGRLTVVAAPGDGDGCERRIQLLDGNQINLTARAFDRTSLDLCTLADQAADHAAGLLNRGPVPARPHPFPPDSLARLDACDVLDDDALRAVPGIDPHDGDKGFGGWECDWDGGGFDTGVVLLFSRDNDLSDDGDPVRLGGVTSYVSPAEEGPRTCVVRTPYRTFDNVSGDRTVEHVFLEVDGPRSTDAVCGTAKRLAADVARNTHGS